MIYTIVLGTLGKDPEPKTVNGKKLVRFSVASNRYQGEGKSETDWMECSAWEQRGEFVEKHFHKGDSILVRGNLKSRKHEGKTYWELDVDKADFTGKKMSPTSETVQNLPPPAGFFDAPADDGTGLPFDL